MVTKFLPFPIFSVGKRAKKAGIDQVLLQKYQCAVSKYRLFKKKAMVKIGLKSASQLSLTTTHQRSRRITADRYRWSMSEHLRQVFRSCSSEPLFDAVSFRFSLQSQLHVVFLWR